MYKLEINYEPARNTELFFFRRNGPAGTENSIWMRFFSVSMKEISHKSHNFENFNFFDLFQKFFSEFRYNKNVRIKHFSAWNLTTKNHIPLW